MPSGRNKSVSTSSGMLRIDGRQWNEPRKVVITPGCQEFAEGSALIEMGRTKVLCSATLEEKVPTFLRGQGQGWVTAEYSMLPRSTGVRTPRESSGQVKGRSLEIQRFIGRCLRGVTNLEAVGVRTVLLDCDVLQADGGTRTAAVTGAYVALYQALMGLERARILPRVPLDCAVAAISVGIVDGEPILDLSYGEDVRAQIDFNLAMTEKAELVEIQGATEGAPFPKERVSELIALASRGIMELFEAQRKAIDSIRGVPPTDGR